jgi:tubulin alpha
MYLTKMDFEYPSFADINKLIAQVMSSTTLSMRSNGQLNCSLRDLQTNLNPYPAIHYVYPSYAPLMKIDSP